MAMEVIEQLLGGLRLGPPQAHRNLALFPLVAEFDRLPRYLLLDEALEKNVARITEVSAEGRVPELAFENASAEKILLVYGDELLGAKQNRILGLSILVGAGRELSIPASPRTMRGRAADSSHARADGLAAYLGAFRPTRRQVGALVQIDGRTAGIELFDSSVAFARHFPKLVRSYALDALETAGEQPVAPAEPQAHSFLDRLRNAAGERVPALGEGEDLRLTGNGITGGALVHDGRVVHLAGFQVLQG